MSQSLETPHHLLYPKLREPLDIRFESFDKEQIILIKCPIGITEKPLGLIPITAPLLQRFTGKKSLDEIASELSAQGVTREIALELATMLDNQLFLESPTYLKAQKDLKNRFLDNPIRPPALSGLSYSGSKQGLEKEIKGYLAINESSVAHKGVAAPLKALMTPHIDYHRGKKCYGKSFQILENIQSPDITILIGTSHQYSKHLFHLTKKHFDSPLGTLHNNESFSQKLAKTYGEQRAFADEMLHKQEHSLELQIPFLKHLIPDTTIVPILVGGFYELLAKDKTPESYEPYQRFIEALLETIEQEATMKGKSVMFLAGVDMAHIGKYFGDSYQLSEELMHSVAKRDRAYISLLEAQNRQGLYDHIASDNDARKICGFPTMYTLLHLFDLLNWKTTNSLIDYRQAVNYQTQCAVTFAGMSFHE